MARVWGRRLACVYPFFDSNIGFGHDMFRDVSYVIIGGSRLRRLFFGIIRYRVCYDDYIWCRYTHTSRCFTRNWCAEFVCVAV